MSTDFVPSHAGCGIGLFLATAAGARANAPSTAMDRLNAITAVSKKSWRQPSPTRNSKRSKSQARYIKFTCMEKDTVGGTEVLDQTECRKVALSELVRRCNEDVGVTMRWVGVVGKKRDMIKIQ